MVINIAPFESMPLWTVEIFLILGFICALTDYIKDKIFNIITLPMMLLGFVICLVQSPSMWLGSLTAIVFAFAIYLPLVIFKVMGAGDAKLSMAFASILGLKATWELFFFSLLIASFGTVAIMIRKKRLMHFLSEIKKMLQSIFYKQLSFHWPQLDKQSKSPFGIAIFLSFAIIAGKRVYASF